MSFHSMNKETYSRMEGVVPVRVSGVVLVAVVRPVSVVLVMERGFPGRHDERLASSRSGALERPLERLP